MKKKTLDYEIENVAGIDHLKLKVAPGVNVLRGKNAAGKSSAMDAIARSQGASVPLERRDGTERGTVTGPGVTLVIRNVVKSSGEAEMELADVGPLARLIDPGLKGKDASARERVRALIELLKLTVDDSFLVKLCQDDKGLLEWLRSDVKMEAVEDLMIASERLRHHSHGLARDQEKVVEQSIGESEAIESRCKELLEAIGGPELLSNETVEKARETLDKVVRRHEREVAQCEQREQHEVRQDRIRETLGDKPQVETLIEGYKLTEQKIAVIMSHVSEMQDKLANLGSDLMSAETQLKGERAAIATKKLELEKWEAQTAILSETVEGPTRESVERIKTEYVDRAHRELAAAQKTHDYKTEEEKKAEAKRAGDEADRLAKHYRDLSAAIPNVLGEILASAGAPGLTVIDGRLTAVAKGEMKDFENRCSTGERVALALKVAATVYRGKVLPLDGLLWASLDPDNQAAFRKMAKKLSLYVITEEPTEGPLRLESD